MVEIFVSSYVNSTGTSTIAQTHRTYTDRSRTGSPFEVNRMDEHSNGPMSVQRGRWLFFLTPEKLSLDSDHSPYHPTVEKLSKKMHWHDSERDEGSYRPDSYAESQVDELADRRVNPSRRVSSTGIGKTAEYVTFRQ